MNKFKPPLKFALGWVVYVLLFWAVSPLVTAARDFLAADTGAAVMAAAFALIGVVYLFTMSIPAMARSLLRTAYLLDGPPTNDHEPEPPPARPYLVRGRRTGSSGQASSSSRTERRAERTLDPAPPEQASALESGAAPPPRAPEPSAARVG
ncbi:hypothetical protein [Pseudomonas sp.]|uniref:hypothetical protein n=1 Tax=Pseudomonas sp. TaxID=306 RepID=UPI0028A59A36|nr:hypothetical protein [Pseudomonas sp.]